MTLLYRSLYFCDDDLPISGQDWENIEHLMTALDICWTDASALALRTAPLGDDFYVPT